MNEKEVMAQQIAGDNFGLSLEDGPSRQQTRGRLFPDERKAFDAGWEAAKQYYVERDARIAEAHYEHSGYTLHSYDKDCRRAIPDEIRAGNVQN